jgi:hypothetical protein
MVAKRNTYDPKAYGTAYKVFLLSNATTLTFAIWPWKNPSRVLPFIIVMKCTKLYDPGAYGLVSILSKGFFY